MFEEVKRAIVVVAHPDDMETIMGGTVALLVDRGIEVVEVLVTSGDIGASGEIPPDLTRHHLAATREEETRAAAHALGVRQTVFLNRPDGEVVPDLALRADIARTYRQFQPDTLFTFDPWWHGQAHPDHTAVGRAAIDAYMPSKMPLYRPEQLAEGLTTADIKRVYLFGGSSQQDIIVDVTPYWERKIEAVLKHKSQFGEGSQAIEWLTKWSGEIGKLIEVPHAEAFASMAVW